MRELADQGSKRAARVVVVQENPTRFISAIQVAITFAGLAIGAVHGQVDVLAALVRDVAGRAHVRARRLAVPLREVGDAPEGPTVPLRQLARQLAARC